MDLIKSTSHHIGMHAKKYYKNTLFRSDALLIGLNCLEPGQVQSTHSHADQDKFYYVIEGTGHFTLGEEVLSAKSGDIVWAAAGITHGVENRDSARLTLLVGIAPAP